MSIRELALPLSQADVISLRAGDMVSLSGELVTARDAAHRYMVGSLLYDPVPHEERFIYERLRKHLKDGAIYHCGPVVKRVGDEWRFVAAGPTTSIREEECEDRVIERFGVRAVIGKGGMGPRTLAACKRFGAVYLHAIGGAAVVLAQNVEAVLDVLKLDLGVPEALWVIRVKGMRLQVTMDAHGNSWHDRVAKRSAERLADLMGDGGEVRRDEDLHSSRR